MAVEISDIIQNILLRLYCQHELYLNEITNIILLDGVNNYKFAKNIVWLMDMKGLIYIYPDPAYSMELQECMKAAEQDKRVKDAKQHCAKKLQIPIKIMITEDGKKELIEMIKRRYRNLTDSCESIELLLCAKQKLQINPCL